MPKKKIVKLLMSLQELDGVTVEIAGSKEGKLHIRHARQHGLNFTFNINDPHHYVGYFIDKDNHWSQAVISLYTDLDAIQFVAAYTMLDAIRARQKK